MTKIIYSITLVNSDGKKASASTPALEYPDTPSATLANSAEQIAHDLTESHVVMSQLLASNAVPVSQRETTNGKAMKHRAGGR